MLLASNFGRYEISIQIGLKGPVFSYLQKCNIIYTQLSVEVYKDFT